MERVVAVYSCWRETSKIAFEAGLLHSSRGERAGKNVGRMKDNKMTTPDGIIYLNCGFDDNQLRITPHRDFQHAVLTMLERDTILVHY